MAFISVIIPVYNAEKTLDKCVNSILQQTYQDFEVLLVDDGSTDGSLDICERFTSKDSRIRIFSQSNQGVSAARNKGIDKSEGDFLCFVDSDDWVEKSYLEIYVEKQKQYSDDVLIIQSFYFDDGKTLREQRWNEEYYDNSAFAQCFLDNNFVIYNAPWNKLFSARLIKKYETKFLGDMSFGEDSLFFMNYMTHLKGIHMTAGGAYHYMESLSFLSRKKHLPDKLLKYYTEYYDYVDKLMFTQISSSNHKYSRFYSNQIQGLTSIILNVFYYQYDYEQRCFIYTKILQKYCKVFPQFRGLTLFETIKMKCLQTKNITLIDNVFHSLFIIRRFKL